MKHLFTIFFFVCTLVLPLSPFALTHEELNAQHEKMESEHKTMEEEHAKDPNECE